MEACKQTFPVSDCIESVLKVPRLDYLSERLLIARYGRKAALGNIQSLYSQPFKSLENKNQWVTKD